MREGAHVPSILLTHSHQIQRDDVLVYCVLIFEFVDAHLYAESLFHRIFGDDFFDRAARALAALVQDERFVGDLHRVSGIVRADDGRNTPLFCKAIDRI